MTGKFTVKCPCGKPPKESRDMYDRYVMHCCNKVVAYKSEARTRKEWNAWAYDTRCAAERSWKSSPDGRRTV